MSRAVAGATATARASVGSDRVFGGRYLAYEVIGSGATSQVYRGRDLYTGRTVAIKVLRRDLATQPMWRCRFRREAQAVAGLSHSGIVAIYDTGYDTNFDDDFDDDLDEADSARRVRVPFIVMEYVAGGSLRDILKRSRPTLGESLHFLLGVLAALEASHRAGVVHRDIKPANVMVTPDGAVKVVDFGIARGGHPDSTLTHAGELLGTPSYLSPEQVRGQPADVRSDLYAAGCLLYELLTGHPPFVGDDPVSVAYRHVHEAPAPLHSAPPALDAVMMKVLAKDPQDRFPDARSFSRALLSAALGHCHVEPATADVVAREAEIVTADHRVASR